MLRRCTGSVKDTVTSLSGVWLQPQRTLNHKHFLSVKLGLSPKSQLRFVGLLSSSFLSDKWSTPKYFQRWGHLFKCFINNRLSDFQWVGPIPALWNIPLSLSECVVWNKALQNQLCSSVRRCSASNWQIADIKPQLKPSKTVTHAFLFSCFRKRETSSAPAFTLSHKPWRNTLSVSVSFLSRLFC